MAMHHKNVLAYQTRLLQRYHVNGDVIWCGATIMYDKCMARGDSWNENEHETGSSWFGHNAKFSKKLHLSSIFYIYLLDWCNIKYKKNDNSGQYCFWSDGMFRTVQQCLKRSTVKSLQQFVCLEMDRDFVLEDNIIAIQNYVARISSKAPGTQNATSFVAVDCWKYKDTIFAIILPNECRGWIPYLVSCIFV